MVLQRLIHITVVLLTLINVTARSSLRGLSSIALAASDDWMSTPLETLTGHTDWVQSVRYSSDGKWLASAGRDGTIILWDLENEGAVTTSSDANTVVWGLDFSADSTKLVSASDDYEVTIWSIGGDGSLSTISTLNFGTDVNAVAFSRDGTHVAAAGGGDSSSDGTIKIYAVEHGGLHRSTLSGHTDWINSLSFAPDDNTLASGSADNTIRLWDVSDGRSIGTFTGHTDCVNSVHFSPDGNQLASGSDDETIQIWDVRNSKLSVNQTLDAHDNDVTSVRYSPDGKYLASGSYDNIVKIWQRNADYSLVNAFVGHTKWVGSVDFSANGQTIASGSGDTTVGIWGLSVGFSTSSENTASGSSDCTARICWKAPLNWG